MLSQRSFGSFKLLFTSHSNPRISGDHRIPKAPDNWIGHHQCWIHYPVACENLQMRHYSLGESLLDDLFLPQPWCRLDDPLQGNKKQNRFVLSFFVFLKFTTRTIWWQENKASVTKFTTKQLAMKPLRKLISLNLQRHSTSSTIKMTVVFLDAKDPFVGNDKQSKLNGFRINVKIDNL